MTELAWLLLCLAAYLLLFLLGVVAVAGCRARPSGRQPPVELRILRGPAESLRDEVAAFHRSFVFRVAGAGLIPIAAAGSVLFAVSFVDRPEDPGRFGLEVGVAAVVFVVAVAAMVRMLWGDLQGLAERSVGCLGHRAVGEAMEPLLAEGYRVFHDVPAGIGGVSFNIDHVAVGPNGVFAVETVTQGQGRARPGFDRHRVSYDGRQLIWPWGEEAETLQQAEAHASALTRWLNASTGLPVTARPVLVLPGWFVVIQAVGRVAVVNHQQLAAAVRGGGDRTLHPVQVEALAGQLDTVCRDVRA